MWADCWGGKEVGRAAGNTCRTLRQNRLQARLDLVSQGWATGSHLSSPSSWMSHRLSPLLPFFLDEPQALTPSPLLPGCFILTKSPRLYWLQGRQRSLVWLEHVHHRGDSGRAGRRWGEAGHTRPCTPGKEKQEEAWWSLIKGGVWRDSEF